METITIQRTERPNSMSFRYAGTGSEMKIYFNDEQDLVNQLQKLNEQIPVIKQNLQTIKQAMREE